MFMKSNIVYILAVVAGFLLLFIPAIEPFPWVNAFFYLLAGGIGGYWWPLVSWRWGLWLVVPVLALTGLSVLFAGQIDVFLEKDLPLLLAGLAAASLGGFAAARMRTK
jgi:hypothetical protein